MAYEDALSIEDYVRWCRAWLNELQRICSPTGSVWINLGYTAVPGRGTAVPIAYLLWDALRMHMVQEIVWYFRAGVACRRRFSPRNEKLLWLVKDPNRYLFDLDAVRDPNVRYPDQRRGGKLRCNPRGRNPTDVWEIPRVTGGEGRRSSERTDHPAQMPLAVAERVVRACSREGDVVLDPFLESGTTAVAALRNGRRAIGIEKDPEFVGMARARIRAEIPG